MHRQNIIYYLQIQKQHTSGCTHPRGTATTGEERIQHSSSFYWWGVLLEHKPNKIYLFTAQRSPIIRKIYTLITILNFNAFIMLLIFMSIILFLDIQAMFISLPINNSPTQAVLCLKSLFKIHLPYSYRPRRTKGSQKILTSLGP